MWGMGLVGVGTWPVFGSINGGVITISSTPHRSQVKFTADHLNSPISTGSIFCEYSLLQEEVIRDLEKNVRLLPKRPFTNLS